MDKWISVFTFLQEALEEKYRLAFERRYCHAVKIDFSFGPYMHKYDLFSFPS